MPKDSPSEINSPARLRFFKLLRIRPLKCAEECIIQAPKGFLPNTPNPKPKNFSGNVVDFHSKRDTAPKWPVPDKLVPQNHKTVQFCELRNKCIRLHQENPILRLDYISK